MNIDFIQTEFKTRKSMRRMLTQDEEDDLVTWLREHTFLYDKSSAQFKMREKKSRTWREKEDELDLNPGDLSSIWYLNMRTLFSRLIKTSRKSGSGAAERTARQEWILNKFEFIRPYLVQLRHQRGSNVRFFFSLSFFFLSFFFPSSIFRQKAFGISPSKPFYQISTPDSLSTYSIR